ncbi:MAG TPA: ABC transporter substrate-binding protein, partial [Pararhizobium sp.]|nr:ABC transporter substrate-binding protein [Pararhizobium sp.]
TLPFVEEQLSAARKLMGPDFWAYGLNASRQTLESFLRHHHEQGLSPRQLSADELFHPATHETVKV